MSLGISNKNKRFYMIYKNHTVLEAIMYPS